jgi:predicted metal-binding membrane protein
MRYQVGVTDFVDQNALSHLAAAQTRLAAALARPKLIAIACVLALTALGWVALGLMAADLGAASFSWQWLCGPMPAGGWNELALALAMWAAMTLAMMLPTAGPMILTYAEIADTAARKREAVVSPLVLTAGYGAVWLGFALAAGSLQWVLAGSGLIEDGKGGRLVAGTIVIGAGLYQFSALKQACLTLCQRPFPFFFANWTTQCHEHPVDGGARRGDDDREDDEHAAVQPGGRCRADCDRVRHARGDGAVGGPRWT